MERKALILVMLLGMLFKLTEVTYCKDIQSVFLSINQIEINPDADPDSLIPCGYENLLKGRTSGIPENMYLWLVVHPEGSGGYWPQNVAIAPHPKNSKWAVKFWLGTRGTDWGKKFELWLVLANKDGNQTYLKYLEKGRKTGKYPEIPLPEGYNAVDMITVIKKRD